MLGRAPGTKRRQHTTPTESDRRYPGPSGLDRGIPPVCRGFLRFPPPTTKEARMAGKKGRSGTSAGSRRTQFPPGVVSPVPNARFEIDDTHPSAIDPETSRLKTLRLCARMQCTTDEIAAAVGCSRDTLFERAKDTPAVAEALESGRSHGRASIKRALFTQMGEGSTSAAIWLSKNFCGMREPSIEIDVRAGVDAGRLDLLRTIRGVVTDEVFAVIGRALGAPAEPDPVGGSLGEGARGDNLH